MADKNDPTRKTREQVIYMRSIGVPVLRIAVALDLTTKRVYQILQQEREAEERTEQVP